MQRPALWVLVAVYAFWAAILGFMFWVGWWYIAAPVTVLLVAFAIGLVVVKPLPQPRRESLPCPNCGYQLEEEAA